MGAPAGHLEKPPAPSAAEVAAAKELQDFSDGLAALTGSGDITIWVRRVEPKRHNGESIEGTTGTKFHGPPFSPGDILDEIRAKHGGGRYRLLSMNAAGQWVKGKSWTIPLAGKPKIEGEDPADRQSALEKMLLEKAMAVMFPPATADAGASAAQQQRASELRQDLIDTRSKLETAQEGRRTAESALQFEKGRADRLQDRVTDLDERRRDALSKVDQLRAELTTSIEARHRLDMELVTKGSQKNGKSSLEETIMLLKLMKADDPMKALTDGMSSLMLNLVPEVITARVKADANGRNSWVADVKDVASGIAEVVGGARADAEKASAAAAGSEQKNGATATRTRREPEPRKRLLDKRPSGPSEPERGPDPSAARSAVGFDVEPANGDAQPNPGGSKERQGVLHDELLAQVKQHVERGIHGEVMARFVVQNDPDGRLMHPMLIEVCTSTEPDKCLALAQDMANDAEKALLATEKGAAWFLQFVIELQAIAAQAADVGDGGGDGGDEAATA